MSRKPLLPEIPFCVLALCCFALLLGGCSPGGPGSDNSAERKGSTVANSSRSRMPENAALKSLYIQSCFGCHSSGAGGAPRTGVAADWAPRWEQSLDTLLQHTKNGIRTMPPKGMCMNCSDEELLALIRFMAGPDPAAASAR